MQGQKVKNISYLAVVPFKLDKDSQEVALLPSGAEVIGLNLEIVKPLSGASVDIGLEGQENYFLDNISAANKGFSQSSVLYNAPAPTTIHATTTNPDDKKDSLAILRVHYFLPSEILMEC